MKFQFGHLNILEILAECLYDIQYFLISNLDQKFSFFVVEAKFEVKDFG